MADGKRAVALLALLTAVAGFNLKAVDFIPGEKTGAAIQKAIDDAFAAGGGRVVLQKGTYLSGTIFLKSRVELNVPEGAVILGRDKTEDYEDLDDPRIGIKPEKSTKVFIASIDSEDIAITGKGVIDGQGVKFYDVNSIPPGGRFFKKPPHPRPRMVELFNCRNVRIEDITLKDSPGWTCWIRMCENVLIDRARIDGDQRMINNDGFHIDCCRHTRISRCNVKSGDDSVIMRAMWGPGDLEKYVCDDLVVEDCVLDSACQAVRLSCPSDGRIRNGMFRRVKMRGRNGVLSGHPARYLKKDHSGSCAMEDILFEDCDIDVYGHGLTFTAEPGIKLRDFGNVTFRNVRIKSKLNLQFVGTPDTVLHNLRFENVCGCVEANEPLEVSCIKDFKFSNFNITSGACETKGCSK